jgi:hypothetical protein
MLPRYTFFGAMLVAGAILGIVYYIRYRRSHALEIDEISLGQCGFWGFTLAAGLHLTICTAYPQQLVHHAYEDGRHYELPEDVHCEIDKLHAFHIGLAGFLTAYSAGVFIRKNCQKT